MKPNGIPESPLGEGPKTAQHLVFILHGIGEYFCQHSQFQFPDIVECARTARSISNTMIKEKFKDMHDHRRFVEFIPIEWCGAIRNDEDDLLSDVSLKSLQFVRDLTNEVLSDVLFYMARTRCILEYVVAALNESHRAFMARNPDFGGKISLLGHSLGSVISFDVRMSFFFIDHKK